MDLFTSFNLFELVILFSIMPLVFIFLWYLIIGDIKNFQKSHKAHKEFTALDPVNCYQNYMNSQIAK